MDALAGMAVAAAASKNEEIKVAYVDGLSKVCKAYMRKRRLHPDWYVAAEAIARGETNLQPLADSCTNQDVSRFLTATQELYESTLKPAVPAPPEIQDPDDTRPFSLSVDSGRQGLPSEGASEGADEIVAATEPVDNLQWQLRRAEFASFGDAMGLGAVYGRMPPECLAPIGVPYQKAAFFALRWNARNRHPEPRERHD